MAQVNKDSIAFDNCTGTGGFLISAMKRMIEDAKGDTSKIAEIKSTQLIGVEYQAHIFALAVSNMYIHQDGKTNIINGSCFDADVIETVKKSNPNVGFLNPPYKSDKKVDTDELEFILNNLECLSTNSTCIAIIPVNCALEQKGKILELKERLLKNHTLEAVLTMPDELFINSDVGVISCIMILTAHRPHNYSKRTYFGYYKNDGFIKRKYKGRIDEFGTWEKVKEKWVNNFLSRNEEPGFSVNKIVSAEDEWCAEAFMETDYSTINNDVFENEILKYSTYLLFNKKKANISNEKTFTNNIIIDSFEWKFFNLGDLFNIEKGRDSSGGNEKGNIPLISATRDNNGINSFILEGNKLFPINTITVPSNGASTGEAFYQPYEYFATGDVNILHAKFELNVYIAIFFITVIRMEKYRFNYGRKWGKARMELSTIKLPAINGKPDFKFMENFVKSLPYSKSIE
ncbi:N-6 DNA methylase [Flavobacterium sp. DG1-102-2]|uniref:N-6 DNA methylase n=1 Tax=Flavobacterium sp. DG1-102-2 TaxID=3081663 RepID=UPI00294A52EC|nr:N-6 DNA methylase [Flavobacterium sp. DG1-102-2]MDV6169209.1 N-6 DNA methylase [Flavobacterium sp. DG1-102-2]